MLAAATLWTYVSWRLCSAGGTVEDHVAGCGISVFRTMSPIVGA